MEKIEVEGQDDIGTNRSNASLVAYSISPLITVDIGLSKILWGENTHDAYSIVPEASRNFGLPFSRFR